MNNAINEIKNTLEGTNSRIMEAEDRITADLSIETLQARREWQEEKGTIEDEMVGWHH